VTELSLTRKVRFLPLPADAAPAKGLGMSKADIPANTYPGQVNTADTPAWQTNMMVAVSKSMSDDTAYQLTKTYMQNLPQVIKGNALLAHIDAKDPFASVIAPLHPGAVRYYKEAGIEVPADLMPPAN